MFQNLSTTSKTELMRYESHENKIHTSHSQMLGKVEYGGGPIFKVVLEC